MTDKSVVAEGMVAWAGGDGPPADWNGGPVLARNGKTVAYPAYWKHRPDPSYSGQWDIIAYTPRSNPLNLETSNLDPITPEEDALATAIIAAEGVTRQSLHGVVRAIRAGLAKAGAVIVPVEPTEAMLQAGNAMWHRYETPLNIYRAMLSAHSIQSGEEGGEAK